jgi:hypothetical protein
MLVAIVQVLLAEERVALGALPPAFAPAVGYPTEAAVAPVYRTCFPFKVRDEIGAFLLADGAHAHLIAVGVALAVRSAVAPAAKLAHSNGRKMAAREEFAQFAGAHGTRPSGFGRLVRIILDRSSSTVFPLPAHPENFRV